MFSLKKLFSRNTQSTSVTQQTVAETPAKEKYVQKFSSEPYDFRTITEEELRKNDQALIDLYTNKTDGYLIKNFLTTEEVDEIMSHFDKVMNDDPAYTSVGFTYPTVFAEFSKRQKKNTMQADIDPRETYFKGTTNFNNNFNKEFGVDVKGRVESLFNAIADKKEILVAESSDRFGNYPFATFRYLTPEKGLMAVH